MSLLTPLPKHYLYAFNPLQGMEECTVKGNLRLGETPHINWSYDKYHGPALKDWRLIGETVQVWYHESDIRVITLYKNGECLGEAYVSRPWRRYPFPRKTRKIIYELTRAKKLNHKRNDDPFQAYFDYLLAQEGSKDAHRELMRISLEWGTFRSSMDTASIDLIIDDQPTDPKPFKPLIHLGADDD